MKNKLTILVVAILLLGLASCRSTSNPCGLADNYSNQTESLQSEVIIEKL